MGDGAGPLGCFNKKATLTWKYLLTDLFYDFPLVPPNSQSYITIGNQLHKCNLITTDRDLYYIFYMTAYKRL